MGLNLNPVLPAADSLDFMVRTAKQQRKVVDKCLGEARVRAAAQRQPPSQGQALEPAQPLPTQPPADQSGTAGTDASKVLASLLRAKAQGRAPSELPEPLSFVYMRYAEKMRCDGAFDMLDFLLVAGSATTLCPSPTLFPFQLMRPSNLTPFLFYPSLSLSPQPQPQPHPQPRPITTPLPLHATPSYPPQQFKCFRLLQ